MAIQMRRGKEADFNPDKMKPGEWAVSLDKKYVRMCFAPGLCFRMATYESFEEDMQEIQNILASVNSTKEAIDAIKLVIDEKSTIVAEKTEQASQYADVATQKAQEATDASNSASESAANANAYAANASNSADTAATKATELGAKVVTISGPDGYVYDPEGISGKKIDYMLELRASGNDVVAPYVEEFPNATFYPGRKPWEQKVDIALPCATQNELDANDAKMLIENNTLCVAEVSNMGCTAEAVDMFIEHKQLFAPGKAVNAGGVATSGLEMTQNAMHISWSAEEVDARLHQIMSNIHHQCVEHGREGEYINYVKGANIAGFMKVARAMMAQGIV